VSKSYFWEGTSRKIFTSSGTFTIPSVNVIFVELYGAGGGGNDTVSSVYIGGGGGGYVDALLSVVPNQIVTIIVGIGGLGGTSATQGTDTMVTVSNITLIAGGGGTGISQFYAPGGIATGGDINIPGGLGINLGPSAGYGSGGSCFGKYGGPGGGCPNLNGSNFGGGGGSSPYGTGNGGNGSVIITW